MPRKRNPQGRKRRRKMRRTRRVVWKNPFPEKQYLKLRYKDVANLTAVAGLDVLAQFRCNDLYDFDYSNLFGNKQPTFFDQLWSATGPYLSFMVVGWTHRIHIQNNEETSCQVGYLDSRLVNAYDEWSEFENCNRGKIRTLGGRQKPLTMVVKGNINKHTALSNRPDPVTYSGSYTASPSTPIYGNLIVHCDNGDAIDVSVSIDTTFHVIAYDTQVVGS